MHRIALFGEDYAHQAVVDALVLRLAAEANINVKLDWRNATGGRPKLIDEFKRFLDDLQRQGEPTPAIVIVATDANCNGLKHREQEIPTNGVTCPIVKAIPDPHIERWLLLDGAAFKLVFGAGCDAPDMKCARDRYKERLVRAIESAGVIPNLGGIEYAADIIREMDLERAEQADISFRRFTRRLRSTFRNWR